MNVPVPWSPDTRPRRLRRVIQTLILLILVVVLVRVFVLDTFIVQGDSMAPSITTGDYLFVYKAAYNERKPAVGDVIVGQFRNIDAKIVKRVMAVYPSWVTVSPTEVTIQDGRNGTSTAVKDSQYVELPGFATNGATTTYRLDPEEYFVMGDNRAVSEDSRVFGPVDQWDIEGRVIARFRFSTFTFKFF